jgi:Family of unknown function (DUF5946)
VTHASVCPGCGVELGSSEALAAVPPLNASAQCYRLSLDVFAFELSHQALLGSYHQMIVDAYGAQHPGDPGKPIRLAYSLVGLYLALELGLSGVEVRGAHMRMGKPDDRWPLFARPAGFADMTIADVAEAGMRADSPAGHIEATREWADAVWRWWGDAHADVAALTDARLRAWLAQR